jgi:hypothetical protein
VALPYDDGGGDMVSSKTVGQILNKKSRRRRRWTMMRGGALPPASEYVHAWCICGRRVNEPVMQDVAVSWVCHASEDTTAHCSDNSLRHFRDSMALENFDTSQLRIYESQADGVVPLSIWILLLYFEEVLRCSSSSPDFFPLALIVFQMYLKVLYILNKPLWSRSSALKFCLHGIHSIYRLRIWIGIYQA